MGKFQIILLLSVVTCAIISTVQSVPVSDSSLESESAAKCKNLCGFCGCSGYYCGDECLCECNSATDGDAACVNTMKSNCKKMELPFEVLIQGPNANRMVRSLLYANPDEEVCVQSTEYNQKKRSTISIYKPNEIQQQDEVLTSPKTEDAIDSPIVRVMVAQKTTKRVADVMPEKTGKDMPTNKDVTTDENGKNMEKPAIDHTNMNPQNENDNNKLSAATDAVDRANIKRHIVDVNQDIAEDPSVAEDGFLQKRDADEDNLEIPILPLVDPLAIAKFQLAPAIAKIGLDTIPAKIVFKNALDAAALDVDSKIKLGIAAAENEAAKFRANIIAKPIALLDAKLIPLKIWDSTLGSAYEPSAIDLETWSLENKAKLAAAIAAVKAKIAVDGSDFNPKTWSPENQAKLAAAIAAVKAKFAIGKAAFIAKGGVKPYLVGASNPNEKPAETPADKPAEKPADKPAETPADKPAETPAEIPAVKPAQDPLPVQPTK